MQEFEIVTPLGEIRDTLCRKHQFRGTAEIEQAIASVSMAEVRVSRLLMSRPIG